MGPIPIGWCPYASKKGNFGHEDTRVLWGACEDRGGDGARSRRSPGSWKSGKLLGSFFPCSP